MIVNLGNWMVDHVDLVLELEAELGQDLTVDQDQAIEQVERVLDSL